MTWDELMAIGRREGVVRWTRSRRIEQLSVNVTGQLVAATMITKRAHVLLNIYARYDCQEVTRDDLVTVGELLT